MANFNKMKYKLYPLNSTDLTSSDCSSCSHILKNSCMKSTSSLMMKIYQKRIFGKPSGMEFINLVEIWNRKWNSKTLNQI